MAKRKLPGLALAVIQDGEVIYARGLGTTCCEDGGLPVAATTLFRIGSITKPLTGTVIMRLVEAGLLDLDRPVREYIPWFRVKAEGAADAITLRMLLTHTSGLPTTTGDNHGDRDPAGLERHIQEDFPTYDLVAPPGKLCSYSNPNLSLAGYIAQVVTGKPYTQVIQDLLFTPLRMERTTFDPLVAATYPFAVGHTLDASGNCIALRPAFENTRQYPAGFAITTALELANFALLHLNEGRFGDARLLSPESVGLMHSQQVRSYGLADEGRGLSFFTGQYKGKHIIYHRGGLMPAHHAYLGTIPEARAAVILLANRVAVPLQYLAETIFDDLLNLPVPRFTPQPVEPTRQMWPQFTGAFLGDRIGFADVAMDGDRLMLTLNGDRMSLHALKPDLYYAERPDGRGQVAVGFIQEESGPVQYLLVNEEPLVRIAPTEATPQDLWGEYVGHYERNGKILTVRLDEGHIYYDFDPRTTARCIPVDRDRFASLYGYFIFQRGESGRVTGLQWGKNHQFTRQGPCSFKGRLNC
jgi:CubicO group peptidase (beta-lactamase class C family)